jgi:uncharacterized protein YkwD
MQSLDAIERAALARCGTGDAALGEAARSIAARRAGEGHLANLEEIALAQRAAGEPHPWARLWAATGASLEESTVTRGLDAWLRASSIPGLRRCGVGSAVGAGAARTLVVLSVDALADLAPLPTRARLGQWLTVEARMHVAAGGGKVFVAGATGLPREIPAWFDGSTIHARFAPAEAGAMTVQVVAELASGPRPVLEATVFADADPPASANRPQPAPGEDARECAGEAAPASEECRLERMLTAARASVGLPPLSPDATLASVARAHAARMAGTQKLAHDVGDGGPAERLRAGGLEVRDIAENVAHAPTIELAHRALWASPSHRASMLRSGMERVGVGVVRDELGEAWAVEIEAR